MTTKLQVNSHNTVTGDTGIYAVFDITTPIKERMIHIDATYRLKPKDLVSGFPSVIAYEQIRETALAVVAAAWGARD